jgi:hypothetical protein
MRTRLSRSTAAFLLAHGARGQGGSGTASLLILAAGSAVPLTPSLMTRAPRRRKPSTTGGRNGTAREGGDPLRSMIDVLQPQRSRYRDTWPFTLLSSLPCSVFVPQASAIQGNITTSHDTLKTGSEQGKGAFSQLARLRDPSLTTQGPLVRSQYRPPPKSPGQQRFLGSNECSKEPFCLLCVPRMFRGRVANGACSVPPRTQ